MGDLSQGIRPTNEELGKAVSLFVDAIVRAAQKQLDEQQPKAVEPELAVDELELTPTHLVLTRQGKTISSFTVADLLSMLRDKAALDQPPGTAPGKSWDWKDF